METIVANRYASALFNLAIEENRLEDIKDSLTATTKAIISEEEFLKILKLPQITKTDKHEMIKNVFEGKIANEVYNFVNILIDKNRMSSLKLINEEFEKMYNEHNSVVIAIVYSANLLTDDQIAALKESLRKKFKSEVEITNKIDTSLISGIRVEANNQIIDNSIFTKLSNLKDNLLKVNI